MLLVAGLWCRNPARSNRYQARCGKEGEKKWGNATLTAKEVRAVGGVGARKENVRVPCLVDGARGHEVLGRVRAHQPEEAAVLGQHLADVRRIPAVLARQALADAIQVQCLAPRLRSRSLKGKKRGEGKPDCHTSVFNGASSAGAAIWFATAGMVVVAARGADRKEASRVTQMPAASPAAKIANTTARDSSFGRFPPNSVRSSSLLLPSSIEQLCGRQEAKKK